MSLCTQGKTKNKETILPVLHQDGLGSGDDVQEAKCEWRIKKHNNTKMQIILALVYH